MNEPEPPNDQADQNLTFEAFLFACGELEDGKAALFLQRLADEQTAREALSQAVCVTGSLAGGSPASPDPAYRAAVRERLRQAVPVLPSRAAKRAWGVQPLLWVAAGAAAMYLLTTALPRQQVFPVVESVPFQQALPSQRPLLASAEKAPPAPATVWADLHTPERLA